MHGSTNDHAIRNDVEVLKSFDHLVEIVTVESAPPDKTLGRSADMSFPVSSPGRKRMFQRRADEKLSGFRF
ncbi:hypothetical protein [Streptomyces virginiae]|uniref:hypothetical protein n=1 Tax=Streptomyces virginiae TaxID=1961 RepID=UPI0036D183F0